MSKPAWEELDFVPGNAKWLDRPDWRQVKGAARLNRSFLKNDEVGRAAERWASTVALLERWLIAINSGFRQLLHSLTETLPSLLSSSSSVARATRDLRRFLRQVRKAGASSVKFVLKIGLFGMGVLIQFFRKKAFGLAAFFFNSSRAQRSIHVVYGSTFLGSGKQLTDEDNLIFFEQGNLRWAFDDSFSHRRSQEDWCSAVARGRHLWVTNLDPPSLRAAAELMPERWAAFPHPYSFCKQMGEAPNLPSRAHLEKELDAQFLIYLPSSQNWRTPYHNKGSDLAWQAFARLRKDGFRVGLIASEWGGDLDLAKRMVEKARLARNVLWMPPLPRIPMIGMLRRVDVCWDQFVIEGFGGVALRAVEAGTPFVGQGLSKEAQVLTGFQVPWHIASDSATIFRETVGVFNRIGEIGREEAVASSKSAYHSWFNRHHSPDLVRQLQEVVFGRVLAKDDSPIAPNLWAIISRKNHEVTPHS